MQLLIFQLLTLQVHGQVVITGHFKLASRCIEAIAKILWAVTVKSLQIGRALVIVNFLKCVVDSV